MTDYQKREHEAKERGIAEILPAIQRDNPGRRWAVTVSRCSIGVWVDQVAKFVPVYAYAITGHWVFVNGSMPRINGEEVYKPSDWAEVA